MTDQADLKNTDCGVSMQFYINFYFFPGIPDHSVKLWYSRTFFVLIDFSLFA